MCSCFVLTSKKKGYFSALLTINVLPSERLVIRRERFGGWYPASAYVCAKTLVELVFQTIYPVLFSVLVYWLAGLVPTAGQFFVFLAFLELGTLVANSIALLVSAATGRIVLAAAALPLAMEVARLYGCYYVPPATLPYYLWWLQAISYIGYPYMGVLQDQFAGLQFSGCNVTNATNATASCFQTGDQVLQSLGIGFLPVFASALVLIGFLFVLRLAAFYVVKFRP